MSETLPHGRLKSFQLKRIVDVSGVSGVGFVAEGVRWWDGRVSLTWYGGYHGKEDMDSMDDMLAIHGHNGATMVEWD